MRDAVGLVVELLRRKLVEVRQDGVLDDLRVQGGHAVDGVREDDGEVGHANLAVPQDGGVTQHVGPVGGHAGEVLAVAAVNLLHEHVQARQQGTEGVDGPLLQCLGHDRVVGVRDGLLRDLEGKVEVNALLVNQQAHELRAAHGGVGVVGVHAHVVAQVLPVVTKLALVGAQDGLQASRDEQVLLLQAQNAAVLAGVVGVQNGGDGLRVGAELEGAGVVAVVEGVEVEVVVLGLRPPQAQAVDLVLAVANDRHVVRDGLDELAALLGEPEAAILLVAHHVAAKLHHHGGLVLASLPGEAVLQPVVRQLHLAAALNALAEEAVAVAHAVAVTGNAHLGHGIHEARGKAAQATVAKAGVGLLARKLLQGAAKVLQRLLNNVAHAKVQQVVLQQGANQELQGEVVNLLLALLVRLVLHDTRLGRDERRQNVVALLIGELAEVLAEAGLAQLQVLLGEVLLALKDVSLHMDPSLEAYPSARDGTLLLFRRSIRRLISNGLGHFLYACSTFLCRCGLSC